MGSFYYGKMKMSRLSRHHLLHEASAWSSREDAQYLRTSPPLIPRIDRQTHNALHEACPPVPLLGAYTLRTVAGLYEPKQTTLGSIDSLSWAIKEASKNKNAHFIERELCELAVRAIRLQIPFLRGETREDWS